jgi:hypothetical protein
MRLSEWRRTAPSREAGTARLAAVVDPVLAALGAEEDPLVWVAWGEEPGTRHTILVPTAGGLISCFVRVNVPGEGPRVSAKLVRWNRVQTSELAIETTGAHRLLSFQVEGHVLQGSDDVADRIAAFALEVIAAIDGRPRPEPRATGRRRATPSKAKTKTSTGRTGAKPAAGATKRIASPRRTSG